jgi:hypothetical protein
MDKLALQLQRQRPRQMWRNSRMAAAVPLAALARVAVVAAVALALAVAAVVALAVVAAAVVPQFSALRRGVAREDGGQRHQSMRVMLRSRLCQGSFPSRSKLGVTTKRRNLQRVTGT